MSLIVYPYGQKTYAASRQGITRHYLGTFEAIAHAARQPEVGFLIGPTTCLGYDVVNF